MNYALGNAMRVLYPNGIRPEEYLRALDEAQSCIQLASMLKHKLAAVVATVAMKLGHAPTSISNQQVRDTAFKQLHEVTPAMITNLVALSENEGQPLGWIEDLMLDGCTKEPLPVAPTDPDSPIQAEARKLMDPGPKATRTKPVAPPPPEPAGRTKLRATLANATADDTKVTVKRQRKAKK